MNYPVKIFVLVSLCTFRFPKREPCVTIPAIAIMTIPVAKMIVLIVVLADRLNQESLGTIVHAFNEVILNPMLFGLKKQLNVSVTAFRLGLQW